MSLANGTAHRAAADVRTRIVDALSRVDGLTAYPNVPDQATTGAAWPRWVQTTYDGRLCSLSHDTYDVLVTLPSSYVSVTVDQGDAFRDLVAAELLTVGPVSYAEPVQITFNDRQTMPGLRLRVTT